MIFTNTRSLTSYNNLNTNRITNNNNNNNNNMMMRFASISKMPQPNNVKLYNNIVHPVYKPNVKPAILYNNVNHITNNKLTSNLIKPHSNIPILPKMAWGAPTWFFLHTIAVKIKDEHFDEIKTSMIEFIVNICKHVPCPICAAHATKYIANTNVKAISTKTDLQHFLFKFHNDINSRKQVQQFTYDELNSKYTRGNTINIYNNFISHYNKKNHIMRLIADDMHRSRLVSNLSTWFKSNIDKFEL